MTKLLFPSLLLSMLFVSGISAGQRTVAVLYFANNSIMDKERYESLRKGLCDIMITELSKLASLRIVEREQLAKIMAEIGLGQSGAIDEASAPKVGHLLGAQILMFGSFIKDMSSQIRIDVRLVEVETGKVLKAEEASGDARKLFKLLKKLTFKVADQLDAAVTADERTRIESTDRISFDALAVYSEGLELLDAGKNSEARAKFAEAVKIEPDFGRAKTQLQLLEEKSK